MAQKFNEGQKVGWLRFDPPIPATVKSALTADRGDGVQATKYVIEFEDGKLQPNVREHDLAKA